MNAIRLADLPKDRIVSAVATVLCEALILYALLAGLKVVPPVPVDDALKVLTVVTPPPPPDPPPPQPVQTRPKPKLEEGAASPPNLRAKPTEIVAPKVEPLIPSPVIAAPEPDIGDEAAKGAAAILGPGTGSGGIGEGSGSGRGGYGPGGGGGGASPPRHISGRLRHSDYPRWAKDSGIGGTVTVILTIETNGRVSHCEVARSSGSAGLDDMTCELLQERYRYRPARDAQGRPVRSREISNHSWVMEWDLPPRS